MKPIKKLQNEMEIEKEDKLPENDLINMLSDTKMDPRSQQKRRIGSLYYFTTVPNTSSTDSTITLEEILKNPDVCVCDRKISLKTLLTNIFNKLFSPLFKNDNDKNQHVKHLTSTWDYLHWKLWNRNVLWIIPKPSWMKKKKKTNNMKKKKRMVDDNIEKSEKESNFGRKAKNLR